MGKGISCYGKVSVAMGKGISDYYPTVHRRVESATDWAGGHCCQQSEPSEEEEEKEGGERGRGGGRGGRQELV